MSDSYELNENEIFIETPQSFQTTVSVIVDSLNVINGGEPILTGFFDDHLGIAEAIPESVEFDLSALASGLSILMDPDLNDLKPQVVRFEAGVKGAGLIVFEFAGGLTLTLGELPDAVVWRIGDRVEAMDERVLIPVAFLPFLTV